VGWLSAIIEMTVPSNVKYEGIILRLIAGELALRSKQQDGPFVEGDVQVRQNEPTEHNFIHLHAANGGCAITRNLEPCDDIVNWLGARALEQHEVAHGLQLGLLLERSKAAAELANELLEPCANLHLGAIGVHLPDTIGQGVGLHLPHDSLGNTCEA
jgi:hypothetical protein